MKRLLRLLHRRRCRKHRLNITITIDKELMDMAITELASKIVSEQL